MKQRGEMQMQGIIGKGLSFISRLTDIPLYKWSALLSMVLMLTALTVSPWDNAVSEIIRNNSPATNETLKFLKGYTSYFKGFGKGDVIVLLAFLLGFCGLKQRAVAIICALIISGLLVLPLKVTVQRERPQGKSFVSFPSGDAATAASFAQALSAGSPVLIPVGVVTAISVSAGRVLSLAHYPSDVIAGMALGIIAGIMGIEISRRYAMMLRQRHFFILFVLYMAWIVIVSCVAPSQNGLNSFFGLYGPVICVAVAVRLLYLIVKYRKTSCLDSAETTSSTTDRS